MLIIAIFLLSLNACGYKAPPYYIQEAPAQDKNVEFILQDSVVDTNQSKNDNNISCE